MIAMRISDNESTKQLLPGVNTLALHNKIHLLAFLLLYASYIQHARAPELEIFFFPFFFLFLFFSFSDVVNGVVKLI
jgi:hypothetical protein